MAYKILPKKSKNIHSKLKEKSKNETINMRTKLKTSLTNPMKDKCILVIDWIYCIVLNHFRTKLATNCIGWQPKHFHLDVRTTLLVTDELTRYDLQQYQQLDEQTQNYLQSEAGPMCPTITSFLKLQKSLTFHTTCNAQLWK